MKKALYLSLIIGFAVVDFLFFHDILKPGESITAAQYLTGILSIFVFIIAFRSLTNHERSSVTIN
jgi:Rps23 Pro-64 3,4-dihydroxylase Tpa1-like proline 4-hydroxylase